MITGPGFPEPLFKTLDELQTLAEEADVSNQVLSYLLFVAPVGELRSADPFLGDLVVTAKEAVWIVQQRLDEMRLEVTE